MPLMPMPVSSTASGCQFRHRLFWLWAAGTDPGSYSPGEIYMPGRGKWLLWTLRWICKGCTEMLPWTHHHGMFLLPCSWYIPLFHSFVPLSFCQFISPLLLYDFPGLLNHVTGWLSMAPYLKCLLVIAVFDPWYIVFVNLVFLTSLTKPWCVHALYIPVIHIYLPTEMDMVI